MLPLWQRILGLLFLMVLTTFWTAVQSLKMTVAFIMNPFGYFYTKRRPIAPKCLTSGWKHSYMNLPDQNIKLHYVQTGDSSKPLMLFVHGFPEFWYTWRHQLEEFSKDYRAVAIDLRGFGDSDKPAGIDNYTTKILIKDIIAFIKALGYNKCILVAHDWGGAIAWQLALEHPEVLTHLIIMNCPFVPAVPRLNGKALLAQYLKSWYVFFFQCPYLPEVWVRSEDLKLLDEFFLTGVGACRNKNALTADDMEAWKYTFGQPGALTPPINYYRAIIQQPPDIPKNALIKPKTLIIWGTGDFALDTKLASLSAEFCENATVKLIDGASHWVQQDEPALCNRNMRQFLANQ